MRLKFRKIQESSPDPRECQNKKPRGGEGGEGEKKI